MKATASCLGPVALSLTCAAHAQSSAPLDIPADTLSASLSRLSRQRGVSIGIEGRLPPFRTPAIHGDMPTDRALARLLSGSGLEFKRLGPLSFRLILRKASQPKPVKSLILPLSPLAADIVVTGNKREQSLATLPVSVAVVVLTADKAMAAGGSYAIAGQVEGLTLTNLGSGRNRQFIRGVADSPFNGATQSTVSIVVNEARVTYNAPDPDLRLVDVDRVEVLKGPQGPLYGSGALGGVYHIVTRQPDLARSSGSMEGGMVTSAGGGAGASLEGVVNLPLLKDMVGLRVIAYGAKEPGWIDNGNDHNVNDARVAGGRIALRAKLADGWTIDLGAWSQFLNVDDSQYVTQPGARARTHPIAEPHDNDFLMASGVVRGKIGAVELLSSTSWVSHEVESRYDASASATALGSTGPLIYDDNRRSSLMDQEVRLSHSDASGLSWLAGLSFIHASTRTIGKFSKPFGGDSPSGTGGDQTVSEGALFGEATVALSSRLSATAGVRLFRTWVENESRSGSSTTETSGVRTGLSPSAALSWRVDADDFLYVRYASALRPGGLSTALGNSSSSYHADELSTIETGLRHGVESDLQLEGNVYFTDWRHVQTDYLLENGLVATRNAGDARIYGAEFSARWKPDLHWLLAAGATAQRAHLTKPDFGLAFGDDRRLPTVPDWTVRLTASRSFSLADWQGEANMNLNYTGRSRLSFDPGLDRRMGNYVLAVLGVALNRGRFHGALRVENLMNSRHDSFAFGNPFSLRVSPQYTPLTPRLVSMSAGFSW